MVFYYDFRERNLSEIGNMTRTLFMAIGNIWTQLMTQHEAVRGQISFSPPIVITTLKII